ncbi:hypothetical protein [Sphingomonas sp. ACRSK]|uniref:hypothetical protein n=1 Tax=Sphingomonas sp. ACRSK TaxID=2918213 RepID=UPI001EF5C521|nr:hypothetical protein [Sphingomonas sp. ACRSK]MCG7348813.1 hypothetical protein [Sphingomonas sp. ACRSK]
MQEHAKLLRYADRQALAHLMRVDDVLTIVVQLWCVSQDHQLRVAINVDGATDDSIIGEAFADLNDESLALCLDELGVAAMLAELEG